MCVCVPTHRVLFQRDSLWLENAMSNNNNMTSINAAKKKESTKMAQRIATSCLWDFLISIT